MFNPDVSREHPRAGGHFTAMDIAFLDWMANESTVTKKLNSFYNLSLSVILN